MKGDDFLTVEMVRGQNNMCLVTSKGKGNVHHFQIICAIKETRTSSGKD